MLTAAAAVSTADRWLTAGILAALVVLTLAGRARAKSRSSHARGTRRRAGAILAVGPLIGLLLAPELGDHALLVAGGAVVLALVGAASERSESAERDVLLIVLGAAAIAVAAGARLGPTGV